MKPPAVAQVRQREAVSLCSKRTKVALFTDEKHDKNPTKAIKIQIKQKYPQSS